MKFEPGIYKVNKGGYIDNMAYLFVYRTEKGMRYRLNNGELMDGEKLESMYGDGLAFVKKVSDIAINSAEIHIKATDIDGDELNFTARNVYVVRDLFKQFPLLAKKLDSKVT